MIRAEALTLLAVADGAGLGEVRSAYLQRVIAVRLEDDPDTFMRLRGAYELLLHGAGASAEEVAAARVTLTAAPDHVEARWRLLADIPYGAGPEALAVLRDGAERRPEAFLDELLFHFPDRVPKDLVRRAGDGAGCGRRLLLADVHATEGRPAEALAALGAALAPSEAISAPVLLKLALRPVFSLQIHLQTEPAREALGLIQARIAWDARGPGAGDSQAETVLKVAVELCALNDTFPLDLRQVAARAAKLGDFQDAPYEAKYATRLLKRRDVPKLNAQLKREAPTLAGILGLDLTEEQLRPPGTPIFLRPEAWGVTIVAMALYLSFQIHREERGTHDLEALVRDVGTQFISGTLEQQAREIEQDCANPDSEACRHWRILFSNGAGGRAADGETSAEGASGGLIQPPTSADGGISLGNLGVIGDHDKSASRH